MNTDIKDYKKIFRKYNFELSDEEIIEIANNIKNLADVFIQFAKNKNKNQNSKNQRIINGKTKI